MSPKFQNSPNGEKYDRRGDEYKLGLPKDIKIKYLEDFEAYQNYMQNYVNKNVRENEIFNAIFDPYLRNGFHPDMGLPDGHLKDGLWKRSRRL